MNNFCNPSSKVKVGRVEDTAPSRLNCEHNFIHLSESCLPYNPQQEKTLESMDSSITTWVKPWLGVQMYQGITAQIIKPPRFLLISNLGWSKEVALEARARLLSFEADWNAPGMEDYDNL